VLLTEIPHPAGDGTFGGTSFGEGSIAVTLVALVIVGVAVFGGGRTTIEAGLGSGRSGR